LRPSQLLHTYGVGATVELPEMTTLVLGLDDWPRVLGEPVSEPRLLAAVRVAVGQQVEQLLTPPVVPEGENAGVPVTPFPRWLRCPLCSLLAPIDHGVFSLRVDAWRPERTTYVHEGCPKGGSRRPPTAFPARYLMACQNGHLDDFPWVEFLHGGIPCRGTLRLVELGAGGRPGDVQLSCDECRRRRRLSQAFGDEAAPYLPPRCRGRHPHLGISEPCEEQPETLILGASNAWFGVQSSALSIPSQAGELAQAVDKAWSILDGLPPGKDFLEFTLRSNADLKKLQALAEIVGLDAIEQAIDERRNGLTDGDPDDLRTPEWLVLSTPDESPETPDFKLRSVGAPVQFADRIADVVLAERLREVSALRGFTRLNAPDDLDSRGGTITRLSREAPRWLPCSEVRGEGIFIRFPEQAILEWEQTYRDSGAAAVLRDAHRGWRARRGLAPEDGWPGERYILLHSFAHALIRELALECGYTASSIRERLYAASGAPSRWPVFCSTPRRQTARVRSAGSCPWVSPSSSAHCCAKLSNARSCARQTRCAPSTTRAPTTASTQPPVTPASSRPRHHASGATATWIEPRSPPLCCATTSPTSR
jgi:hypothetical protein